MKAYSEDLRQRIVDAVDQGMSRLEVVRTFQVSLATVKRYLKHRRDIGRLLPKPCLGRPSTKGGARGAVGAAVGRCTRCDVTRSLRALGSPVWVQVSTATMSRTIRHHGWTRKKDAGCG